MKRTNDAQKTTHIAGRFIATARALMRISSKRPKAHVAPKAFHDEHGYINEPWYRNMGRDDAVEAAQSIRAYFGCSATVRKQENALYSVWYKQAEKQQIACLTQEAAYISTK